MRSLFRFLAKNHVLLLFLVLEIFSLVLIFNYNNFQRVRYFNTSNRITGSIYNSFNRVVNYFKLSTINEELAVENSRLKSELEIMGQNTTSVISNIHPNDSLEGKFIYRSALIINNSVNKQYNYFTLNKGSNDGIRPDQGIISEEGIVGIVSNVSEKYSTGISLLNRRMLVSGKLKKNNFFGSVSWDGLNYRYVMLSDIPSHAEVAVGDSVVTRGSSTYFPEGILIGTVESVEIKQGENFYTIQVKLAVDFKSITYVEVVENSEKDEIIMIENLTEDDQDLD
ncbi:MAG: rod shape-determining protein MreC [Prolixibacteraceae bacterium]|nr:rod shape-determining protein MreC [Prolixibacteraceae bacterium]MBN2773824.1 rod shape-determining protein MreC [Prolixibacteraceae bacterium]